MIPRKALCFVLGVATVAVVIAGARAQETDTSESTEPAESSVVERVEVRLVEMQVLARDGEGNPITDLTADEIVVKFGGKRAEVAGLDRVAALAERDAELPEVRLKVDIPGGADVDAVPGRPRYFILFVDADNDARLERPEVADRIGEMLEGREQHDPVAVISYNGELRLESGFTTNPVAMAAAVRNAYSRAPRAQMDLRHRIEGLITQIEMCVSGQDEGRPLAHEQCLRGVAAEHVDQYRPRAVELIEALEGVIRFAGGHPTPATVVALTHGVAIDPSIEVMEAAYSVTGDSRQLSDLRLTLTHGENAEIEWARLHDLALRERVVLYVIDRSTAPTGVSGARQGGVTIEQARPLERAFAAPQTDMREITGVTGGLFRAEKYPERVLRRFMDLETQGRYTLTFYSDRYLRPKEFGKVKVSASRKGVKIDHSRGLFAREPYGEVLGDIAPGVLGPRNDGQPGKQVPFSISFDPRKMDYEEFEGYVAANLTLHVLIQTREGQHLANSFHFMSHSYPMDVWDGGAEEQVTINGWLEAEPGSYRVQAIVRNPRTGQQGTIECDVEIPSS